MSALKIYAVRVEVTRWADVCVVAESLDAAESLAFDRAQDILDDADADSDETVSASEARGGWEHDELPCLTDEAAEAETEMCGTSRGRGATCSQWAEAIARSAPIVDALTVPMALPYADGRVETVSAVPQRAAGGES